MWTWKAGPGAQAPNLSSLRRRWLERAAGAPDAGRLQPHGGLRAAAGREDHQPVLLGLADGRAPEPALAGPQQHRALHCALAHQPRLHDLQRWLPGAILVPEVNHGLELPAPSRVLLKRTLPSSLPAPLLCPSPASVVSHRSISSGCAATSTSFWDLYERIFFYLDGESWWKKLETQICAVVLHSLIITVWFSSVL